jgi:hypothetical protein
MDRKSMKINKIRKNKEEYLVLSNILIKIKIKKHLIIKVAVVLIIISKITNISSHLKV